jgi:Acetyltransferase (GNAT) family
VVAGALTGRSIPIPYERGDAADLSGAYMPLLELEAVAAGTWFLNVVSVHPEFRGQGLGSILLSKAEEIACASGAIRRSACLEHRQGSGCRLRIKLSGSRHQISHGRPQRMASLFCRAMRSGCYSESVTLLSEGCINQPLLRRSFKHPACAEGQKTWCECLQFAKTGRAPRPNNETPIQ